MPLDSHSGRQRDWTWSGSRQQTPCLAIPQKKTLAGLGKDRDEAQGEAQSADDVKTRASLDFVVWKLLATSLQFCRNHKIKSCWTHRACFSMVSILQFNITIEIQHLVFLEIILSLILNLSWRCNGWFWATRILKYTVITFSRIVCVWYRTYCSPEGNVHYCLRTRPDTNSEHQIFHHQPHYNSWVYTKISICKFRERCPRINGMIQHYLLYSDCAIFFSNFWLTSWVSSTTST